MASAPCCASLRPIGTCGDLHALAEEAQPAQAYVSPQSLMPEGPLASS